MLPSLVVLLRIAWRQYLNRFDLILYGHIVFTLPLVGLAIYLKQLFPLPATVSTWDDVWPNLFIQLAVDYGGGIITSIVVVMVVLGMQAATQKKPVPLGKTVVAALRFYPAAVLVGLIEVSATTIGLAAFIIPGIIASTLFALVVPALVWNKLTVWQAIQRVWQLAKGRLLFVVSYLLMVQIVVSIVLFTIVWGLPLSLWFDLFAGFVGAVCASYYTVFTVILLNALETTNPTSSRPRSV